MIRHKCLKVFFLNCIQKNNFKKNIKKYKKSYCIFILKNHLIIFTRIYRFIYILKSLNDRYLQGI